MLNEALQRALEDMDINTDRAAWMRFCEWVDSFHELDIGEMIKYPDHAAFSRSGEDTLPLKYLETIEDLWLKWSRAVQSDSVSNIQAQRIS